MWCMRCAQCLGCVTCWHEGGGPNSEFQVGVPCATKANVKFPSLSVAHANLCATVSAELVKFKADNFYGDAREVHLGSATQKGIEQLEKDLKTAKKQALGNAAIISALTALTHEGKDRPQVCENAKKAIQQRGYQISTYFLDALRVAEMA